MTDYDHEIFKRDIESMMRGKGITDFVLVGLHRNSSQVIINYVQGSDKPVKPLDDIHTIAKTIMYDALNEQSLG